METTSNELVIFGAKSIALGACLAIRELYPECRVKGFMVSRTDENANVLCGLPVKGIPYYTDKSIHVLVATPEDIQDDIVKMLNGRGYHNTTCLDSQRESRLMNRYYERIGKFPQLRENIAEVYVARFHGDKPMKRTVRLPEWAKPIQVGASLTDVRIAGLTDDTGENISYKNGNYCELTALYWIWKNRLHLDSGPEYYGLFHYRRFLDISDGDFWRMRQRGVDVVLPYPTVHEPDISEHHGRYIKEGDWDAMLLALDRLHPDYAEAFRAILKQQYLYNYNILVARRDVLRDYCEWLFPILERVEELSAPKGNQRADRYIGYLGENLLTLYFMYHGQELNVVHTGKIMVT